MTREHEEEAHHVLGETPLARAASAVALATGWLCFFTLLNHGYLGVRNRFPLYSTSPMMSSGGAIFGIAMAAMALVGSVKSIKILTAAAGSGLLIAAVVSAATWREDPRHLGVKTLNNPFGAGGAASCLYLAAAVGLIVLASADHVR
jgi:hypothetical protein